jgi:membrane-associated phospholipid phosphatase
VGAGLAFLAAGVLLGLTTLGQGTWLDHAIPSVVERLVPPGSAPVRALASELGWPHGAYATAVLPVAVTMVLLLGEVRRHGARPVLEQWRWILLTLAVIPVHYVLRVAFGRPGPGDPRADADLVGSYPSGAALAVGLGWAFYLVVVGELRPRWRPWVMVLTVFALVVHAAVRVVTAKHWTTDILGSYLLVAGAFLLASTARRERSRQHV